MTSYMYEHSINGELMHYRTEHGREFSTKRHALAYAFIRALVDNERGHMVQVSRMEYKTDSFGPYLYRAYPFVGVQWGYTLRHYMNKKHDEGHVCNATCYPENIIIKTSSTSRLMELPKVLAIIASYFQRDVWMTSELSKILAEMGVLQYE